MLPKLRSHQQYLEDRCHYLHHNPIPIPSHHYWLLETFSLLDLSPLRPIVEPTYSEQGRPAYAPEDIFRSFLVMLSAGTYSIDQWVDQLHSQPFYVVLSGFSPDDIPSVGTFYGFIDRLLQLEESPTDRVLKKPRRVWTRPEPEDGMGKETPHPDIIRRLASRIRRMNSSQDSETGPGPDFDFNFDFDKLPQYQRILKEIFYQLFIPESVERGLLDPDSLYVAGDGSLLATWANPYGHKICNCKGRCDCPRRFHDPTARVGYDPYRERFIYGHRYYELTAYSFDHEHELPLAIQMGEARRHDSVLSLMTMHEAKDYLRLPIQVSSFDTASDNLPFYQVLIEEWNVTPVIPFNPRNTKENSLKFDEEGRPICEAGFPMYYWGRCPDRQRLKWRCPLQATKKEAQRLLQRLKEKESDSYECKSPCPCSNSSYGRVIYTYPHDNYRHHPPLPRHTFAWQRYRKKQTTVERSHATKKEDFGLSRIRTAGRERWFFWIMIAAMLQHLRAWAKEAEVWKDQAQEEQRRERAWPRAPNLCPLPGHR